MIFFSKEMIVENFRKILREIRHKNYISKSFSYILILIYFSSLASSLLTDKISIEANDEIDELFLKIIFYSDLSHIFRDFIGNDHMLLIILIVMHAIFISFYIILCVFYNSKSSNNSIIIEITFEIINLYQKIYIWVITYPSFSLIMYFFIHKSDSVLYITETCFLLILICLWYFILYYTEFQTVFLPQDEFAVVYTNNFYILIFSAFSMSIFKTILPIANHAQIMVFFGVLGCSLKIFIYWRDLPFIDENISKFYGCLVHIEIYLMTLVGAKQNSLQYYNITGLLILGTLFIVPIFLQIRNQYSLHFLVDAKIQDISNAHFYFLAKKVIEWIQAPLEDRRSSTIFLTMFLRAHAYSCRNPLCFCKSVPYINNIGNQKQNQYEKHYIVLQYKQLLYQIINDYFELKINSPNHKTSDIDFKIIHILFLMYHLKRHVKAYVMICTLINSRYKYGTKLDFILKNIREEMEDFMFDDERKRKRILFKDVLNFYNMLLNLRENISTLMNCYWEFLYKLTSPRIDLNEILSEGKKMMAQRKNIHSLIRVLTSINENHKELNEVINLYTSLNTVDDSIRSLLDAKKIGIKKTQSKNKPQKADHFMGGDITLLELFGMRNCIFFIQLTPEKLGMIKKVTPNFSKMFGYSVSQAELFNVSHLMPLAIGLHHNNFITNFIERNQSKKLDVLVNDGYGLHKNGYIFMMDVYIKMECFNGELCIAGCIHKKDNNKEVILTTANGYILNFTPGFKKLLFLPVNTGKIVYDLPLPLIIPRLILTMGAKINKLSKLYQYFDANGVPNFEFMLENADANNPNIQTGDIADELVYALFPKSRELINEIMVSFNQVTNLGDQDESRVFEEYIKGARHIYEKYDHNSFTIYKLFISYKERKFRGGFLHIRILDMIYPSLVKNPKQVLGTVRHYLETLEEFYDNHESKHAFNQFSKVFMNFSPLFHEYPDNQIYKQENMQELIEVSSIQTDSINDLQISEKEAANEIFNSKEPHSSKNLFFPKGMNNLISSNDVVFGVTSDSNSPNNSDNNLVYLSRLASSDIIIETNQQMYNNPKNIELFSNEPNATTTARVRTEILHDQAGILTERPLLLPKDDPSQFFVTIKKNKDNLAIILDGKIDNKPTLNTITKRLKVIHKISKKIKLRTEQENTSDIASQQNKINAMMLRSEIQNQNPSNMLYSQVLNQEQIKQAQELEERQSASSRASSTAATTKRFRNLLSDDVSVPLLHKVKHFGGLVVAILIGIIIATFIIFQQSSQKIILYAKTNEFTDILLSPIATYGKYLEMETLHTSNLLSNLDFQAMNDKAINLLNIKEKEYRAAYDDIISGDHILNELLNLNYSAYNFVITLLNRDNSKSYYEYSFHYGLQVILQDFDILDYAIINNNTEIDNNFNYRWTSSKYYLKKNFPVYFDTIMKISDNDIKESFGGSNLNIKNFTVSLLILFIVIEFIVGISIYPIFKYVEIKKFKGLSLISTFSIKNIEAIQIDVKFIQLANQNLSTIGIKAISNDSHSKNKRNPMKVGTIKEKMRVMRDWRAQNTNPLKFIAIVLVIFGLLTGYFTINSTRLINHAYNLNQFYNEFDLSNYLTPCIQTEYFIAYHSLNLYLYDTEWQTYFNQTYLPRRSRCHQKIEEIKYFWQMIDGYINNNNDMTSTHKKLLLTLKSDNLCKVINSRYMSTQMILECQSILYNAASSGFIQLINSIQNGLESLTEISINNTNQATSQDIIKGIDFQGLDILMYYSNFIFMKYMQGIKHHLEDVLSEQLIEGYIVLFIGIGMLLLFYMVVWIPLLKFKKMEFKTVKRIYCLFPLEMVISNQYIKKWLEDNAKKLEQITKFTQNLSLYSIIPAFLHLLKRIYLIYKNYFSFIIIYIFYWLYFLIYFANDTKYIKN